MNGHIITFGRHAATIMTDDGYQYYAPFQNIAPRVMRVFNCGGISSRQNTLVWYDKLRTKVCCIRCGFPIRILKKRNSQQGKSEPPCQNTWPTTNWTPRRLPRRPRHLQSPRRTSRTQKPLRIHPEVQRRFKVPRNAAKKHWCVREK